MIKQLGKYRIDGVLGTGAMGVVYKGFDPHIARAVALKTIRKELFNEHQKEDLIARFKNEAQAAGRLLHPNIVMVYDYGQVADTAYIAMEFVDATPLNALLVTGCPTETGLAVVWVVQLLRALNYAHACGVNRRDVKPANLLVTSTGQVKIADFGVASIESAPTAYHADVAGTPSYMPPEQFRGEATCGRSDLFSAGVILYQLLTGKKPFSGSASVVRQKVLAEEPTPPSRVNPDLGEAFDALMCRALAKNKSDRYPSAKVFLDALMGTYNLSLAAPPVQGFAACNNNMKSDGFPPIQFPANPLRDVASTAWVRTTNRGSGGDKTEVPEWAARADNEISSSPPAPAVTASPSSTPRRPIAQTGPFIDSRAFAADIDSTVVVPAIVATSI